MKIEQLQPGIIICGDKFPEPVKVLSSKMIGTSRVKIEAVGINSDKYYQPVIPIQELINLQEQKDVQFQFTGNPESVFLYLEGTRIRNAFQFDPLYGISASQIDPLPHQIEAIYHYILKSPNIRFLLADDPGAGKTIMGGLLIKELKYRGLVNRVLIVVPGHLKDQWLREMKERFSEKFLMVDRGVVNASWSQNVWTEFPQIITSLDFIKQNDVQLAFNDARWDLVIVDEAHKMSAYKYGEKVSKTARYTVGETLSSNSKYLILLTATPHRGDPENFKLFLDLLQPNFFANTEMLATSIEDADNPLFLRRLKEDLKNFDGQPLFPPRLVETIKYYLNEEEKKLYNAVTDYVEENFNKALQKEKRNVAFALTVLQRRLASSVRAVLKSLERRKQRLEDLYKKGKLIQDGIYHEDYLEDLEDEERYSKEEELLAKLTSAESLDELKLEITNLEFLVKLAKAAEKQEIETKLNRLREVLEERKIRESKEKLLIFTESKDTMEYLAEKLKKWQYSVTLIHGGLNMDARIKAEHEFKNQAQIMVATEAAGEGINLQFCWLMVNYDIPWNPNRLEQRMGRIHRYGQQHEVHIYNLVALDTREGKVLQKLFDKLEAMKEALGDRVFDVIGDVLQGASLKDLILDAIANKRTIDDILAQMDKVPDMEAINKVKQASLEALATRHIDLSRINQEQRTAKENRLVPEYIERFFLRAAKHLKVKVEKRQNGFWRIPSVPFELRNQPHEFKLKYGEVQREYLNFGFDKNTTFKAQAELVTSGHPLMEAILEHLFKQYPKEIDKGSVFLDPDGKWDGLLWFMSGEIQDGSGEIAGRRLVCLYQDKLDNFQIVNPSVLWDLKPNDESTEIIEELVEALKVSNLKSKLENAIAYILDNYLDPYQQELLQKRLSDAQIKRKYGLKSIDSLILESEAKLTDYEIRKIQGDNIPDVIIGNEQRNRDDLEQKKLKLEKDIRVQTNLYLSEPEILSVIQVIPIVSKFGGSDQHSNKEIELIGMETTIEYEKQQQRNPQDVSLEYVGYDIRSCDDSGNYRYIEVKARSATGAISLTPNEWVMANRLGDEYWLYIVENAATNPTLYTIQNPALHLNPAEEVSVIRYVVNDWRYHANCESNQS
ncbi:MAG: helicase-related protein [Aphanizomenon gracile PMC644.10]|nr:helicase-related protein [Aphanizomenon gracile PMC644.10]